MVKEFNFTKELQPMVDQEKDRLKELLDTDDVVPVGCSFVYLVDQTIVVKNSLFSTGFDETDYISLSADFEEFLGVRTGGTAERLAIRRQISEAGHEFFGSLGGVDTHLQDIAGAFMAANEDYVLNHSGERETNDTISILQNGFTTNQKRMIERVRERLPHGDRWVGGARYMLASDGTPTFILYIQDYRDIAGFFDVQDACEQGNCGFVEKRFGDFTVLFYTDPHMLCTDFPTTMEVGSVHLHNSGLYIDFTSGLVLYDHLFKKVFGTLPPTWLRTLYATLSLKLYLGDARLQQQDGERC